MKSYTQYLVSCVVLGILAVLATIGLVGFNVYFSLDIANIFLSICAAIVVSYYLNFILKLVTIKLMKYKVIDLSIFPLKIKKSRIYVNFNLKTYFGPSISYSLSEVTSHESFVTMTKKNEKAYQFINRVRVNVLILGCICLYAWTLWLVYFIGICFAYFSIYSNYKKMKLSTSVLYVYIQNLSITKEQNDFIINVYKEHFSKTSQNAYQSEELIHSLFSFDSYQLTSLTSFDEVFDISIQTFIDQLLSQEPELVSIFLREVLFQYLVFKYKLCLLNELNHAQYLSFLQHYIEKDWQMKLPNKYIETYTKVVKIKREQIDSRDLEYSLFGQSLF